MPSFEFPSKIKSCNQLTLKYKTSNQELSNIDYNRFNKGIKACDEHHRAENIEKRVNELERRLKTFKIPNKLVVQSKIANIFKRSGKSQDDYETRKQIDSESIHQKMIKSGEEETPKHLRFKSRSNHNDSKNHLSKNKHREKKLKKDNIYSFRAQFEAKHRRAKSEVALISNSKARLLNIKQNNGPKALNEQAKKNTSQVKLPIEYKTGDKSNLNNYSKTSKADDKPTKSLNFNVPKINNTARNKDPDQGLKYAPKIQSKVDKGSVWSDNFVTMQKSNKNYQSNKEIKVKKKYISQKDNKVDDADLENYPIIGGRRILPSLRSKQHFTYSHLSTEPNSHKAQNLQRNEDETLKGNNDKIVPNILSEG